MIKSEDVPSETRIANTKYKRHTTMEYLEIIGLLHTFT